MRRQIVGSIVTLLLSVAAWVPATFAGSSDILNGSVAVPAVNWVRYPVIVTPGMLHPRIVGRLVATGGTGNDIVVAVMGDADFTNWANGHTGSALYNSGQVTMADVRAELPEPGVYVVLLDNKFSALTAKTVEGRLRLLWDEPPPPPAASEGAAGSRGGGGTGSNQLFNVGVVAIALLGAVIGGLVVWVVITRSKAK